MDKSWMHKSRVSKDYELGVESFLNFGFSNTNDGSIRCPCLKCGNYENKVTLLLEITYMSMV